MANEGQTNVCYQCTTCIEQNLPGTQGTYMAQDCMPSSDRVCMSCRTSCALGQYVGAYCNRTSDMQCKPCATTCPPEKYRSATVCSGSTTVDTQLADCKPCLTQCGAGQYLSGTCPGTTSVDRVCFSCSKNLKTCKINEYEGGCGGSMDTRCIPYTVCPAGYYLADESQYRDGVCRQCSTCDGLTVLRPCTSRDDAVCRGAYSCGERADCPRLTASNKSSYFCDYSQGASLATCGVCPPGYGSDGQYCTECLRGYTCDRVGGPACRGQCGPEYRSECVSEFGLDYARCRVKCELVPGTRKPWRGSFVLAGNEDCATYFLCTPGYYKNFSSGGTVTCEACQASLLPVGAVWVTDGLSVEDDASCLWECQPDLYALSANGLGCVARPNRAGGYLLNVAGSWRGLNGGGVCGIGRTSQAGTAIAPEECLACQPLVSDVMRWKDRTDQCEFECVRLTDTKLGSKCVRERTACSGEGLLLQGTTCVPQTFPWNSPGFQKKITTQGVAGWIFSLANSTTGTATNLVYPLATSVRGGIKNRHTVTAYAGAVARSVEGALCSQTIGWVGGYQYVFGSLCNQSFLVYLNLSSTTRGLGVLIGNGTRGWRDGFRTQALFESELYVAGTGNGTLFVLDRWNCLLREVVVWDRPGSYLTRVYTLWGSTDKLVSPVAPEAKCYGSGSLAWPRQWWPLWGDWLAFADEDGLWQFQRETRELLRMMSEADAPVDATLEVDNLRAVGGNASALVLDFADGTRWVVRANQEACPTDWTSLAGGACTVECRWLDTAGKPNQYVDYVSGACRACSQPVCVLGEVLEPCTPTSDARCQRCELYRDAACADCPAESGSNDTCIQCDISSVQVTDSTGMFFDVAGTTVFQFLTSGAITFSSDTLVDVLVVGGGGSGNGFYGGGGGGAGTVIFAPQTILRAGRTYSVIVGDGSQPSAIGSVFVAAAGGWGTGTENDNGGRGGGVGGSSTVFGVPGIYTSPNAFANPGAGGGAKNSGGRRYYWGGAGGGAGGPGQPGECGAGGAGISQANISGVVYVFSDMFGQAYTSVAVNGMVAEGGTGGWCCWYNCGPTGLGGYGGSYYTNGGSGKANTGSGGGGAYYASAGGGGSGLVLIRKQGRGNLRSSTDPRDTRYCNVCRKRAVLTYSVLGTCEASTLSEMAPCRAGWYLGGGGFCVRCPQFTATLFDGATRVEQCKCLDGMVRRGPGDCVADGPYERFDDDACVDGTCRLPRNARARLDDAETCGWACNAGFYRDSNAGFLDQCRPCLGGSGRTRGDDGEPWSCE